MLTPEQEAYIFQPEGLPQSVKKFVVAFQITLGDIGEELHHLKDNELVKKLQITLGDIGDELHQLKDHELVKKVIVKTDNMKEQAADELYSLFYAASNAKEFREQRLRQIYRSQQDFGQEEAKLREQFLMELRGIFSIHQQGQPQNQFHAVNNNNNNNNNGKSMEEWNKQMELIRLMQADHQQKLGGMTTIIEQKGSSSNGERTATDSPLTTTLHSSSSSSDLRLFKFQLRLEKETRMRKTIEQKLAEMRSAETRPLTVQPKTTLHQRRKKTKKHQFEEED